MSRRRRRWEYTWIRASRRRLHHSSSSVPAVPGCRNRPDRAKPSACSAARAISVVPSSQRRGCRQLRGGHRPHDLQVTAYRLDGHIRRVADVGGSVIGVVPRRVLAQQGAHGRAQLGRAPEASGGTRPPGLRQLCVEVREVGARPAENHLRQQVVQLVGVAHLRRHLGARAGDGVGVQGADLAQVDGKAAWQAHGPRAALLQRRLVEEREGPAVQDLVRQGRRLGCVAELDGHVPGAQCPEQRHETLDVGGFVQGVVQGLAHQQVVGDGDRTGIVVPAGRQAGEGGGHHVVGLHPLDRRRVPLAALEAQHRQRPVQVPAPAHPEQRRDDDGLREGVGDGAGVQHQRHVAEGEAVLGSERQHHGVVVGRGLQLEVEGAAEALAQCQPQPRFSRPP